MNDSDLDIIQALKALRPREPNLKITSNIAQALDIPSLRRGVIVVWSASIAACAACFVAGLVILNHKAEPEGPSYRLVQAERTRPEVQLYQPIQLQDGSYARPMRVRWEDTTRWQDSHTQAHLVNYRPNDLVTLLPLDTY